MKVERQVSVANKNGLHARPAMQLVEAANRFSSDITFTKPPGEGESEPTVADGKSVMQVITLGALRGTTLQLVAEGDDAEAAADTLCRLFEEHFGETDDE